MFSQIIPDKININVGGVKIKNGDLIDGVINKKTNISIVDNSKYNFMDLIRQRIILITCKD